MIFQVLSVIALANVDLWKQWSNIQCPRSYNWTSNSCYSFLCIRFIHSLSLLCARAESGTYGPLFLHIAYRNIWAIVFILMLLCAAVLSLYRQLCDSWFKSKTTFERNWSSSKCHRRELMWIRVRKIKTLIEICELLLLIVLGSISRSNQLHSILVLHPFSWLKSSKTWFPAINFLQYK